MVLNSALERISLDEKQQSFWQVQIEHIINTYNHNHNFDQRQAFLGSHQVYYELDHFHRSLRRKPRPKTIIRNWKRLH